MTELCKEKSLWWGVVFAMFGMIISMPLYDLKFPTWSGYFFYLIDTALSSRILAFLLPVLAVLPMGAGYVRDIENGFLKLYISRINREDYVLRRVGLGILSGFLVIFLAGVLLLVFGLLFWHPFELEGEMGEEFYLPLIFTYLTRMSLLAAILAAAANLCAVLFRNYYMAYGLPFVCYYFLIIFKERYFSDVYIGYPPEWILGEQDWGMYHWKLWIFLLGILSLMALVQAFLLDYRLKEI